MNGATTPPTETKDETSVVVAVRARPLIAKEKLEKCTECTRFIKGTNQIIIGTDRAFTFDYTFPPDTAQEDLYNKCVSPLVESFFQGYNATVFAYGQTGSGKTFTMGSGNTMNLLDSELGVIPRVIKDIFDKIEARKTKAEFMVRVSYLEIYNEELKDLLHPSTPSKSIVIREKEDGDIIVVGIKEEVVTSFEELMSCLQRGAISRTTGSTLMNEVSSRSHSIFTIILEQRVSSSPVGTDTTDSEYITAKFHLVDLAGSERAKRTGAVGIRFKEGVTINCGLLALGNVISALGDERKRGQVTHVPYRESKLTRLLQDSLGGNSRTLMIACISPADTNFEETLNTLKYANRAKNIKNKPIINRDPRDAQLAQLRNQIQVLQLELLKQRIVRDENGNLIEVGGVMEGNYSLEDLLRDEENRKYINELRMKTVQSSDMERELIYLRERNLVLERETKNLKDELNKANHTIAKLEEQKEDFSSKLLESHSRLQQALEYMQKIDETAQLRNTQKEELRQLMARIKERETGNDNGIHAALSGISNKHHHIGFASNIPIPDQRPSTAPTSGIRSNMYWAAKQNGDVTKLKEHTEETRRDLELKKLEMEEMQAELRRQVERATTIQEEKLLDQRRRARKSAALEANGKGQDPDLHAKIKQLEEELLEAQNSLRQKQSELIAAHEDLQRDEEIFAEKLQIIKKCNREIKDLKRANNDLKKQLAEATQKIHELSQGGIKNGAGLAIDATPAPPSVPSQVTFLSSPHKLIRTHGASIQARKIEEASDDVVLQSEDSIVAAELSNDSGDEHDISDVNAHQMVDIAKLEEEKAKILEEKRRIEQEKEAAELQAQRQQKEFQLSQQNMQKRIKDLSYNIKLKEQLIREMVKSEHESQVMREQYEKRIQEMESIMITTQHELERAMKELEISDMEQAKKEKEKERIRTEYENKLRATKMELEELRKKQQEGFRLVREKNQSDRKIKDLEGEISRMRSQQEALKKKMKEEFERNNDIAAQKSKQIALLKRQAELGAKRIRELENENRRQQLVLARKAEEIQLANRKLKEQQEQMAMASASASPPVVSSRPSTASSHRSQAPSTVSASSSSTASVAAYGEIDKQRAWLDKEIEQYLKKKAAMERLEKELSKREAIVKEREETLKRKSRMEMQLIKSSQVLNSSIMGFSQKIEQLELEIESRKSQIQKLPQSQKQSIQEVQAQIQQLQAQVEKAKGQKAHVEESIRNQQYKHEEELRELNERAEILDEEIKFKTAAIVDAERELQEAQGGGGEGSDGISTASTPGKMFDQVRDLSKARSLLKKYFDKVIELKDIEGAKDSKICELEIQLSEAKAMIDNLQNSLKLTEMEYDRKLTKQQKEHELKVQYLLRQISANPAFIGASSSLIGNVSAAANSSSSTTSSSSAESIEKKYESIIRFKEEQISILDKDNYYYKATNRDLKQKLRELRSTVETDRVQLDKLRTHAAQLQESNAALAAEVKNLKSFLSKHHAVQMVQSVRKSVKALTEDELPSSLSIPLQPPTTPTTTTTAAAAAAMHSASPSPSTPLQPQPQPQPQRQPSPHQTQPTAIAGSNSSSDAAVQQQQQQQGQQPQQQPRSRSSRANNNNQGGLTGPSNQQQQQPDSKNSSSGHVTTTTTT